MLLVFNLSKERIKEDEEIKSKENLKKISAYFLALCWENWGSGKKMVFLLKKTCNGAKFSC